MEEEKVAGLYFDQWDLPSAMLWYDKAVQKLPDEASMHQRNNLKISIVDTWIRMGNFEKALECLNDIALAANDTELLNLESVIEHCRSLCITSFEECKETADRLEDINRRYMNPSRPLREREAITKTLNTGSQAFLMLSMGEYEAAKGLARDSVSEWERLRDQKSRAQMSTKEQTDRPKSTKKTISADEANSKEHQSISENHSLVQSPSLLREARTHLDEEAEVEMIRLDRQLENRTKNLLDSQLRLVKIQAELGEIGEAFTSSEQILDQMQTVWGRSHVVTLRAFNVHAKLLLLKENFSDAEATCKNSLRSIADHLGSDHYITLGFVETLVKIYLWQGRWREAHEIAENQVVRTRKAVGENHPQTIESEMDYAYSLSLVGKATGAERWQESVQAKCERFLGCRHSTTLLSRSRLAIFYYESGKLEKAYRQITAVHEQLEGRPRQECSSMDIKLAEKNIGSVARRLGDRYNCDAELGKDQRAQLKAEQCSEKLFKIARHHLERAASFYKVHFGDDHRKTLLTLFETHLVTRDQSRKVRDGLLEKLWRIQEKHRANSGGLHPEVAAMQHELSLTCTSIGIWKDALSLETASLKARVQIFGTSHPDVARSKLQLATILWCSAKAEEAADHLSDALDTIQKYQHDFPVFDMLSIKRDLVNILVEIGDYERAIKFQQEVVHQTTDKSNQLFSRKDLASIYQKAGRLDDAKGEHEKIEAALKAMEWRCSISLHGKDPPYFIGESIKVSLQMEKGNYAEAEKLQRRMKKTLKKHPAYGEQNRETITCRYNLAIILKKQGKNLKAAKQLRKAVLSLESLVGEAHMESKEMRKKLEEWTKNSPKFPALNSARRRDSACSTDSQKAEK